MPARKFRRWAAWIVVAAIAGASIAASAVAVADETPSPEVGVVDQIRSKPAIPDAATTNDFEWD